jgi:hypothetical protein
LLDEIKSEATRGANDGNLNYLMPAFTALLIKMSEAADRRAKILVWLTWTIAILTLALVAKEGFDFYTHWGSPK